uniref:Serpentine receptor class gamma n=1 Tax=Panagrellus redivivus TaxID=6233 RepID=A0A7E4V8L8_PANRE
MTLHEATSEHEHQHPPTVVNWIQGMDIQDLAFLVASTVCCFIVILIGIIEYTYVRRHVTYESIRHYLTWVVFMLPATTFVSVLGMYYPRSAMFLEILSASYLMITLGMLIKLTEHLFGSRKAIVSYMNTHGIKINLNALFLCTKKLCCLPELRPTAFRIHCLEWLVYQTAFVRIITMTTVMMGFFENFHAESMVTTVSEAIMAVSLFFCIYGTEVMKDNTEEAMKPFNFGHIHNIFNASHIIMVVGKGVFLTLIKNGYIEVGTILQHEARALYLTFFVYSVSAVFLSIYSLIVFNPKRNALFDRYGIARPIFHRTEEVPLVELLAKSPRTP